MADYADTCAQVAASARASYERACETERRLDRIASNAREEAEKHSEEVRRLRFEWQHAEQRAATATKVRT